MKYTICPWCGDGAPPDDCPSEDDIDWQVCPECAPEHQKRSAPATAALLLWNAYWEDDS